jgi:hypothetical protein
MPAPRRQIQLDWSSFRLSVLTSLPPFEHFRHQFSDFCGAERFLNEIDRPNFHGLNR